MTIEVKWRDIWFGRRNEPGWCPIARAMNRATGERWAVYDGYAIKLFQRPIQMYPLPQNVMNFVWALDSGATVMPFTFEF